ncbi:hypothetical protein GCM10017788_37750 [Amycolatopsis acidiphila]|nr:hypothetical protein GCM10017788_37750 [Amycolatopsis acidiphila]
MTDKQTCICGCRPHARRGTASTVVDQIASLSGMVVIFSEHPLHLAADAGSHARMGLVATLWPGNAVTTGA